MPWRQTHPMDQRQQFVREVRRGQDDMSAVCARFAISRKTGYEWLEEAGGWGTHATTTGIANRNTAVLRQAIPRARTGCISRTSSPHNAAFHLRASDATGGGCSLSRGARQAVNAMASLNIALVRCKG
jgi:transposase-like protein